MRPLDEKDKLKTMNWFYGLELNQVDLYISQSHQAKDVYLKRALQRIAAIEQQHADNIGEKIRRLGYNPSPVGDILGPIIGKAMGAAAGYAGAVAILKLDIAVEEKAMKDYKNFIMKSGQDEHLFDLLWNNLLDEDFHTAWLANKLKEYEKL